MKASLFALFVLVGAVIAQPTVNENIFKQDGGNAEGRKLSIDGNTAAISGAAIVQIRLRNQGGSFNWGLNQTISSGEITFGAAVSLDGDYLAVAASRFAGFVNTANVKIYERVNWVFGLVETINNPSQGSDPDNLFGNDIEVSGDFLVIGAPSEGNERGTAWAFERNGGGSWTANGAFNLNSIIGALAKDNDRVGFSVSVYTDGSAAWIALGAPLDEVTGGGEEGTVHVVRRTAVNTWSYLQKLRASVGRASDQFGSELKLDTDVLFVGAPFRDLDANAAACVTVPTGPGCDIGRVYIFSRSAGTYSALTLVDPPSPAATGTHYGFYIDVDTNCAIIGSDTGVVTIQVRTLVSAGQPWRTSVILAPTAPAVDFGKAVGLWSAIAAVGAFTDGHTFFYKISASACGHSDPHFTGFDGSRFDFHGELKTNSHNVYNLIVDRAFALNAEFMYLPEVHEEGTYMAAVGIVCGESQVVLRRDESVSLNGRLILSGEYNLENGVLRIGGNETLLEPIVDDDADSVVKIALSVSCGAYKVAAMVVGNHIDIQLEAIPSLVELPHGIIGQTLNRIGEKPQVSFGANAEGIIEGEPSDYRVHGLTGHEFAFSTFGKGAHKSTLSKRSDDIRVQAASHF